MQKMNRNTKELLLLEASREKCRDRFTLFQWAYLFGAIGLTIGVLDAYFEPFRTLGIKYDTTFSAICGVLAVCMLSAVIRQFVEEAHYSKRIRTLRRLSPRPTKGTLLHFARK